MIEMMELRNLRKSLGIKRVQLAKDLGVNVRTITRWEQNEVETMTLKNAKKLANYFNKSLDELFLFHSLFIGFTTFLVSYKLITTSHEALSIVVQSTIFV